MVLLGNCISFVGCFLMIAIGFIKKKEHILTAQCGQFALQGIAHLILGALSGFLSCMISIARILVFTRAKKVTVWHKLGFLGLQAVLTIALGADSLADWLPMLSVVLYTWYLDTENVTLFKLVNIVGVAMWVFYDILHLNYAAFAFDILTVISTVVGIIMVRLEKEGR